MEKILILTLVHLFAPARSDRTVDQLVQQLMAKYPDAGITKRTLDLKLLDFDHSTMLSLEVTDAVGSGEPFGVVVINGNFGDDDWVPIRQRLRADYLHTEFLLGREVKLFS